MTADSLRTRMLRGDILSGTFVKTPSHDIVEIMALSGLDYITIDAEHAPFDRGRLDATAGELNKLGVLMFHIASEHGFALAGARQAAESLAKLQK